MGFILQASCATCDYKSEPLIIGDGIHFIDICNSCHSVVQVQQVPFRFTLTPFPLCKGLMYQSTFVDSWNLVISRNEPVDSEYHCPKCNGILGFKELAHFTRSFDERVPKVGQHVHGVITSTGELYIPFCTKFYATAQLKNAILYSPETLMELVVQEIQQGETDAQKGIPPKFQVLVEFVRYLEQEDLDIESINQPWLETSIYGFFKAADIFDNGWKL